MPVPVAFVATLVITTLVAAVIGAICVRLKEIYFAFVTLAFQMLIHSTILSWVSLTGGDQGLRGGIPRPAFFGIDLSNHLHLYIVSCALLVIGLLLMRQIAQSPFGYTLRMIRDNANRASFIGIDVWRAKLTIFVLAALFASTGGIIMALFVSGAYPEFAYWTISGEGIFINMLGGVTTFLGPMVGTVLLLILNDTVTRCDRVSRHRARHRDPVLRHRPAERPDGFCRRMVRATPRRFRGARLAMLEIRSLSKSFGGVKATDDVTLDFADGSLTAVIGPNGAGKSTFFNLITGALKPDSGQILLNGVDLAGRSPPEIVRHGIGRAFQVASIFPSLTVQETMLAAVCADQRRASVLHRRFPLPETRDRAEHAMELLGLAGKRNRIAATLSHGDQKLLDIALALVLDPKVLLLDEPTAGMGTEERWRMIDKVQGALGDAEDHGGLHRARHGYRVQDRARDRRALLRPDSRDRHAGCDPPQRGRDRGLSRHRASRRSRGMSAQPVVQVEDLDVYYGTSQILFGVGLSVRQGETMALLGRNGAGKSTTMKAIMGLAPARRGKVTVARQGRVRAEAAPHRASRPRLRAGGSPDISGAHGRGQSGHRRRRRGPTARTSGRSGASTTCFRCWSRCGTGSPAGCRAASSRCWRLPAR